MGITKGLQALKQQVDRANNSGDGEKTQWVKLAGGESVKIKFLQEIDPDSPLYDDEKGLLFMATEVSKPGDFRVKCLDSQEDEGKSFGWEMHNKMRGTEGYKNGWIPKQRLYANVLVDDGVNPPHVRILSQGMSGKSITPALLQYADDNGSITDLVFRITRTGTAVQDTSYSLTLLPKATMDVPDDIVLYDLETVAVRRVPYAEQHAFFFPEEEKNENVSVDTDW